MAKRVAALRASSLYAEMVAATELQRAKEAELLDATRRRQEHLDEYNAQLVQSDEGEHYT